MISSANANQNVIISNTSTFYSSSNYTKRICNTHIDYYH